MDWSTQYFPTTICIDTFDWITYLVRTVSESTLYAESHLFQSANELDFYNSTLVA